MAISATVPAVTHVAVTVSDFAVSEEWYTRVLGVKSVLDEDTGPFRHVVYELGNTLLGLRGFPDLASYEPFDERKPGLDHIAFGQYCPRAAHPAVRSRRQRTTRHLR